MSPLSARLATDLPFTAIITSAGVICILCYIHQLHPIHTTFVLAVSSDRSHEALAKQEPAAGSCKRARIPVVGHRLSFTYRLLLTIKQ